MERSVFVLLLLGQCSFSTCGSHEYHFIRDQRTWSEAQRYCRDHYTDLATVDTMADLDRLCDGGPCEEGWIGLHAEGPAEGAWLWFSGTDRDSVTSAPPPQTYTLNCGGCYLGNFTLSEECPISGNCEEKRLVLGVDVKLWLEVQRCDVDLKVGPHPMENHSLMCQSCEPQVVKLFKDMWRWSDGGPCHDQEMPRPQEAKSCVVVGGDRRWMTDSCDEKKPFYCHEDKLVLVQEAQTWSQALDHCRTYYRDLASITDAIQLTWVQKRAQTAGSDPVWVGLRYTCSLDLWFWAENGPVCYQNWAPEEPRRACGLAGAVVPGTSMWVSMEENEVLNFICST